MKRTRKSVGIRRVKHNLRSIPDEVWDKKLARTEKARANKGLPEVCVDEAIERATQCQCF